MLSLTLNFPKGNQARKVPFRGFRGKNEDKQKNIKFKQFLSFN